MFGKRFPDRQPGRKVTPAAIRAPDRFLEQLAHLRGGRGTLWTPFGPQITQPGLSLRMGITGSDGIPAASGGAQSGDTNLGYSADVGDCYITITQRGSAVLTAGQSTFDGYNLSTSAVAANTNTIYMFLWNAWICIWEDCSGDLVGS